MNVKLVLWVVALVEAILCNSHEGCAVGILLLAPYPCFLQGKRLLLQCEVRHPVKIEIVDFFDFGACNAQEHRRHLHALQTVGLRGLGFASANSPDFMAARKMDR